MQFTIYRNKGNARAYPYLLDVQSDIIGELATRIGVRLEKGNYPTLSAFFAQMATD
ncbi:hypothetical protein STW0522ENT60_P40010 (plasmid) [Enterobacter kobei]|nr:hypothetical protein STW0522ENT60_P40010 [Enterobacter kobei]